MLNATDYATLMNEAAAYAGEEPRFTDVASLGEGTNWQDALFNDGAPVQNHLLSVSGATDKVNYYFSVGYYNQEGIIGGNYDKSNYERLSFRSNTLYTLFDESANRNWLKDMKVGVNVSYSRINSRSITDLSPLRELTNLQTADIRAYGDAEITDWSPVEHVPNLIKG